MVASAIEAPDCGDTDPLEVAAQPAKPVAKQLAVGESVTRGALALLSTQPLTWGASLATTAFAPRLLGADAFGQFTIATTVITIAATATSLGVSEYLVRRVAQRPASLQQDLGIALVLQTVTAVLGTVFIALLSTYRAATFVDTRIMYVALLALIIAPAQTVLLSSFRGRELHVQYAWFNAAVVVIGQVGGLLVLVVGGDVVEYTATVGVVAIGATLVGWKLSGLRLTFPSALDGSLLRSCREFTLGGFPFLTSMLTVSITGGIDRVLLGLFVPAAEVGWYGAAYRIFAIPVFIPTLIITPLFPALSRSVHAPETIRRTVAKTVRVMMLLMVPLSAGTVVVAPAIPKLLGWPADFDNAVPMIALLALQLPLVAVDMVFGVVLMAIGRQARWVTVGVVAAGLKILLDYLVIPTSESFLGSGAVGASVVTLVTELVMFGGAVVLIPKHLLEVHLAWDALRIVIAGGATVIVGSTLLPVSLGLSIACGAGTYLGVALVLRAVSIEEFRPLARRLLAVVSKPS